MSTREIWTFMIGITLVLLLIMLISGCKAIQQQREDQEFKDFSPLIFEILGDKDAKK